MGKPSGESREAEITVTFHRHRNSISRFDKLAEFERGLCDDIIRALEFLNIHVDSIKVGDHVNLFDHGRFLDSWIEWDDKEEDNHA
jgi:hypothetical protein